jgi:hypothetical protein
VRASSRALVLLSVQEGVSVDGIGADRVGPEGELV